MSDLQDGETTEMKGSGAKPYVLKNVGGVCSCSCPAWRNQSVPIERRTCKHLRKLRGDEAEKERIGSDAPMPSRKTSAKKDAPPLLLAQSWDNSQDLKGWWISEKLDGVRAYWDGKKFLSRLGNLFHAPAWFTQGLPDHPLDGELWIDRGAFQRTVSIVRRQDKSDHWKEVRFKVFDLPAIEKTFEKRMTELGKLIKKTKLGWVEMVNQNPCEGTSHLKKELARIEKLGGEGLMLREPESLYEVGRSWTLLKVKSFHDAEAVVVGVVAGKGKHKGRMGALKVRLADGTDFSVGTGFSDRQRENPPASGSVITFRYQEKTNTGVPRFPSFLRAVTGEKAAHFLDSLDEKTKAGIVGRDDSGGVGKATRKKAPAAKSKGSKVASKPKGRKPTKVEAGSENSNNRYFELVDGKSSKFWEIAMEGDDVTVRYGRIGAAGTRKTKSFEDAEKAQKHYDKLVDQKTNKGYEEK